MTPDALSRILDKNFTGRVWRVGKEARDGFVALAGCWVQPHPGQTVPAEADVLAWEADDAARQDALTNAAVINAARATIDASIAALERRQHRAAREHILGNAAAKVRLQAIDDEIAALRAHRP